MFSLNLTVICVFFFLETLKYGYVSTESSENWIDEHDWKLAIKKIRQLEKIVKIQDERILTLEKRPTDGKWKSMTYLQRIIEQQNDRISQLETRLFELQTSMKIDQYESNKTESLGYRLKSNENAISSKSSLTRKGRLLLQPTPVPIESVAFYAYFSTHETVNGAVHHILAFDTVITNVRNCYHPHSGSFIAPRSGLYVFTWTIRLNGNNYHTTDLVVNNNVVNTIYLNPQNIDGTTSSTVVVHVNQGEDVLIRTGNINNGLIVSDTNGRSSFAGWILM